MSHLSFCLSTIAGKELDELNSDQSKMIKEKEDLNAQLSAANDRCEETRRNLLQAEADNNKAIATKSSLETKMLKLDTDLQKCPDKIAKAEAEFKEWDELDDALQGLLAVAPDKRPFGSSYKPKLTDADKRRIGRISRSAIANGSWTVNYGRVLFVKMMGGKVNGNSNHNNDQLIIYLSDFYFPLETEQSNASPETQAKLHIEGLKVKSAKKAAGKRKYDEDDEYEYEDDANADVAHFSEPPKDTFVSPAPMAKRFRVDFGMMAFQKAMEISIRKRARFLTR